jgi:hypothetical protein
MGWFKIAQIIGSKGGKKVYETITKVKGKYNIGSADKIKSKAAKAKLESVKSGLERTFSKTDKGLKKLKKSVDKTKNLVKHYYPPKDFLK